MMGGDGNYGRNGSGWEICGTDGPGYQPGQLTKEKNIRKRKKSKRKTSEKEKATEEGGTNY